MLTTLMVALILGLALLCAGANALFDVAVANEVRFGTDAAAKDPRLATAAFWCGLVLTACSLAGFAFWVASLAFHLLLWSLS